MILTALANYYEQLRREHPDEVPEQGWSRVKVTHLLVLSGKGELLNIIPAPDKDGWMKRVPEQDGRSGTKPKPYLLADKSKFILGVDAEGVTKQSREYFDASKEAHLKVFSQVDSAAACAVCEFFRRWDPEKALDNDGVSRIGMKSLGKGTLAFWYESKDVAKDDGIVAAWEKQYKDDVSEVEKRICLATGKRAPIARIHPVINGVQGATNQPRLVNFNINVSDSYGHKKGFNAPVSQSAAFAYGAALNFLTKKENSLHHVNIGDMTVVYWSEHADEANSSFMSFSLGGAPEDLFPHFVDETSDFELDAVMGALSHGHLPNLKGLDSDATFHVLGLAGGKARITARFYAHCEFGVMLNNVMKHYEHLAIACNSQNSGFISPRNILKAAEASQDAVSKASWAQYTPLLQAVLNGTAYPEGLFRRILSRASIPGIDEETLHVQAAFIKAYLIRNAHYIEEGTMEELDEKRQSVPYSLGQLFAVLEYAQLKSSPTKLNSTIKDKYFGAVLSSPARVFPELIKKAEHHMKAIRSNSPELATYIDKTIAEKLLVFKDDDISFSTFPKHLSLYEQGDFILGYYHEKIAHTQKDGPTEATEQTAIENR